MLDQGSMHMLPVYIFLRVPTEQENGEPEGAYRLPSQRMPTFLPRDSRLQRVRPRSVHLHIWGLIQASVQSTASMHNTVACR